MRVMAEPPDGTDGAASSAAHPAAGRARAAHKKQVKELAAWERKEEISIFNIKISVNPHLLCLLVDCITTQVEGRRRQYRGIYVPSGL